jgi:hypothetical protein
LDRLAEAMREARADADPKLEWIDLTMESTPEEVDEACRNTFESEKRPPGRHSRCGILP